jgi:hypothetical protein
VLNIIKAVFIILLLNDHALAKKAEKFTGGCQQMVPELSLDQALVVAREIVVQHLPADGFFIDAVALVCQGNQIKWQVGFRRKAYESGHLIIYINMDKTSETLVVKDG